MKKTTGKSNIFLFFVTAFFIAGSITSQASGDTLTFNYDIEFSGATAPAGPAPWLTATFDDSFGGANNVRLTMSAGNLQNVEFVDDWLFNFDSSLTSSSLSFNFVSGTAGAANNATGSNNAYKADGDGWYDILFDYPPPPGSFSAEFTTGEIAVYDIEYTSAIDVSSFNFLSLPGGGQGVYQAAAHVQGIADASCPAENPNCESGWVSVAPEPISSTLFLIGGAVLGGRRFFNRKK